MEGFGDASRDVGGFSPLHRLALRHDLCERPPFEVLEGDVERSRLAVLPDVVHDDDARMGQARGHAGLREEALLEGLSLLFGYGEGQADGLEGDGPTQGRVVGLVDDAHHSTTELPPDFVPADRPRQRLRHEALGSPFGPFGRRTTAPNYFRTDADIRADGRTATRDTRREEAMAGGILYRAR